MLENEELELKMSCIDTDKCSRILLKDASAYTLSDLMKQYGLESQAEKVAKEIGLTDLEAHDALTDAIWHYILFKFLMTKVENSAEKLVE
jgi:DNA polymerase III epsilon subunit-like protein